MATLQTDYQQDERPGLVALIGDGPEFGALREHLASAGQLRLVSFSSLQELATLDVLRTPPDFVIVLQSRNGQHAQEDLDTLRRVLSDSNWLCVIGSHAEGETRSGRPLAGIERVHWSAAIDRFQWMYKLATGEVADVSEENLAGGGRPADRLIALNQGSKPYPDSIGVVAATSRLATEMVETCEAVGFCAERIPSGILQGTAKRKRLEHLNLCLWSAEVHQGRIPPPLAVVVNKVAPCPVLAIADFVRIKDHDEMRAVGAAGVLTRPFVLEDLVGQISRLARPTTLPARTKQRRQAS